MDSADDELAGFPLRPVDIDLMIGKPVRISSNGFSAGNVKEMSTCIEVY